jgi:hypothetical protein
MVTMASKSIDSGESTRAKDLGQRNDLQQFTARQSSSCTWPHTLEGYESRLTSSPSLRHQFPSSKSPFGVQR